MGDTRAGAVVISYLSTPPGRVYTSFETSQSRRESARAQLLQGARHAVIKIAAKAGAEGDADAVAFVLSYYRREAARNAAARGAAARPIVAPEQITPP